MKRKNILLLIGNEIGFQILKKLKSFNSLNLKVYTSNKILARKNIKFLKSKKIFISKLKSSNKKFDFVVCVYWPWLFPKELFKKFNNSINFHPSLLPVGRGWYPHVHALIKNLKWGVTLHKISYGIDNGKIWCQKEIKFNKLSTAVDLYETAKYEIVKLFNKNIKKIINEKITPKEQKGKIYSFKKKQVRKFDKLFLNKKYKLIDLIKISNSRTFKNINFNFFYLDKKKYSFKILIEKIN